jgi:pimeloyl-ACP methyl ester carboxylesterase
MTPTTIPSTSTAPGRYAPVNGLQLYYQVHGSGRPLVLLHGSLLTIDTTFGPILPALAENHQVIALEMQGHGHTADTDRAITLDTLADDVVTLLGQLGIDQADVFGFSLGAMVGLTIALERPDVLGKLVLVSGHYRGDGYHDDIRFPEQHPDSTRMPTPADFEMLREIYLRVAPIPEHFERIMNKVSDMVSAFVGWEADELRDIPVPTLLVVGDNDFVRLDHAVEMFELIPDSQLAVLPGTTHVGIMQDADRLLAMVAPFLTD